MQELELENRRLKEEVAHLRDQSRSDHDGSTVELDLERCRIKLRNVETPEARIDHLDLTIPDGKKLAEQFLSLSNIRAANQAEGLSLLDTPVEATEFRVLIREEPLTRTLTESLAVGLRAEGISNLSLDLHSGNRFTLAGTARRLVNVPFRVNGTVSVTQDHRVRIGIEAASVLGVIPLPHILRHAIMKATDDSLTASHFSREGDSYLVDPSAFVPRNVSFQIDRLSTSELGVIAEGGRPGQTVTERVAQQEA